MGKRGLGDACGFQGTLLFPSVNGIPGWPAPGAAAEGWGRQGTDAADPPGDGPGEIIPWFLKRKTCSKKHCLPCCKTGEGKREEMK